MSQPDKDDDKPDGKWNHEETFQSWNKQPIVVGLDLDGDLGILDDKGYSIGINWAELPRLIEHLQKIQMTKEYRTAPGVLSKELETYEKKRSELLAEHEGKYVVIHDEEIAGFWDTWGDALKVGYKKFSLKSFLIKRIETVEQVHFIPRDLET